MGAIKNVFGTCSFPTKLLAYICNNSRTHHYIMTCVERFHFCNVFVTFRRYFFSVRISNGSHMVVWHNFSIITSCFIGFCCNLVIFFILFSYISQSWKRCKYVDIQIFSYRYADGLCAELWQNHNSFVLWLIDIKSDFRLTCWTPQCIMEHW